MIRHTEEFKQEAVRIALTSRVPRAGCIGSGDREVDAGPVGIAV